MTIFSLQPKLNFVLMLRRMIHLVIGNQFVMHLLRLAPIWWKRNISFSKNDINGKPLGGSATTADFLSESKKYAQMKKQKQREPNSNSGKFFCDVNIFHLSYFTHSVMFSAEQKLKRKSDQIPSSAGAGKKAKQNKMPSSKSKKQN